MLPPEPNHPATFGPPQDAPPEPTAFSALAETLLMIACLASAWPLVLGWTHWGWYALAGLGTVALMVLLARRIRRMHAQPRYVPPPGHPERRGPNRDRKLS